jgi:HD-GYP domain-containing protein (c-di-GMP phosphodiesterase class II)
MVRYSIDDITDDMLLGESLVTHSGKVLLHAGYRVTEKYKKRLKDLGYRTLLIDIPGTEEVRPGESVVSPKTHAALTGTTEEAADRIAAVMARFRADSKQEIHKFIFEHRRDLNEYVMNPTISRQLETVLEEIMGQPDVVLNLAALKKTGSAFYAHSVNVAITALCIGKKHSFPYEEMKQLGVGALNYHVGLMALPRELVRKGERLDEEERKMYRQHTVLGHLMLAQNAQISPTSAIVALQHHEMQNGKGYPLGLKGSNRPPVKDMSRTHVIHRFAEIVTVCDTYHSLISNHAEGDPALIGGSIKKLISMSGILLNRHIVKTLVSTVPVYPVGTRVRITDAPDPAMRRLRGVVAKDNPADLSRPVLILYEDLRGQRLKNAVMIDTADNRDIRFEMA